MYIVVSKWQPLPGKEEEFEARGRRVRGVMEGQPGVKMMEAFTNEQGQRVAIIGYESEETYDRITNDPEGAFAKTAAQVKLEDVGSWLSSERGPSVE